MTDTAEVSVIFLIFFNFFDFAFRLFLNFFHFFCEFFLHFFLFLAKPFLLFIKFLFESVKVLAELAVGFFLCLTLLLIKLSRLHPFNRFTQ